MSNGRARIIGRPLRAKRNYRAPSSRALMGDLFVLFLLKINLLNTMTFLRRNRNIISSVLFAAGAITVAGCGGGSGTDSLEATQHVQGGKHGTTSTSTSTTSTTSADQQRTLALHIADFILAQQDVNGAIPDEAGSDTANEDSNMEYALIGLAAAYEATRDGKYLTGLEKVSHGSLLAKRWWTPHGREAGVTSIR